MRLCLSLLGWRCHTWCTFNGTWREGGGCPKEGPITPRRSRIMLHLCLFFKKIIKKVLVCGRVIYVTKNRLLQDGEPGDHLNVERGSIRPLGWHSHPNTPRWGRVLTIHHGGLSYIYTYTSRDFLSVLFERTCCQLRVCGSALRLHTRSPWLGLRSWYQPCRNENMNRQLSALEQNQVWHASHIQRADDHRVARGWILFNGFCCFSLQNWQWNAPLSFKEILAVRFTSVQLLVGPVLTSLSGLGAPTDWHYLSLFNYWSLV